MNLGGVSLGLESSEESLLGSENLDGRGGVLGEVGKRSSVRDEPGSNGLSEEGGKVGRDEVHLLDEVGLESLPVVGEVDDSVGEVGDVDEIDGSDVGSHGSSGSVEDVLGPNLIVVEDLLHLLKVGLGETRLVSDELSHSSVLVIVGDESDKLGVVPSVPERGRRRGGKVSSGAQMKPNATGCEGRLIEGRCRET